MKCAECGKEIESNCIEKNGLYFCNNLHRFSYEKNNAVPELPEIKTDKKKIKGLIARKIIFGLIWFVVIYFLALVIGGAIAGSLSGMQAAQEGISPYEAGSIAGQKFGNTYGAIIFWSILILAVLGSTFGILPGTKLKKKKLI